MRRRHGQKKIETWKFRVDGQSFEVDVYLVRADYGRGEATKFLAVSEALELKIEDVSLDELRKKAKAAVEVAGKTTWSKWIHYSIRWDPDDEERETDHRVELSVRWSVVERADVGKPTERYRDCERRTFGSRYDRVHTGSPETGFEQSYRGTDKNQFHGLIPFDEKVVAGFKVLDAGMKSVYDRLRDVLFPGTKTDPAKWLAAASVSGVPLLPSGGRKERKR